MTDEFFANKKKYIAWGLGLWFFVLFLASSFGGKREEKTSAELLVFGDSIFAEVRDETGIPAQLSEQLKFSLCNASLGGTRMARGDLEGRLDYDKDAFSMVGLAKSISADDFGVQRAARIRESLTEYFPDVIEELASVEMEDVELILMEHGLNDYYSGIPIENSDDPYDEYTYKGALRTSLEILEEQCPNAQIVLVTPMYSWYLEEGNDCETRDFGGGFLESYVLAQMEVAEEYGLDCIDLYHDFLQHENYEDWKIYTKDGIHPNEAGRALIVEKIASKISDLN